MASWLRNLNTLLANLRPYLPIRRSIPTELEQSFEVFKDIRSIDRLQVAAWLGVFLTFALFGLDLTRHLNGTDIKPENHYYKNLVYIHAIGLLYLIPALHITRRKAWIKETRLRRGIVIWGMVVLTGAFLLVQALIVYYHRGTTTVYLGFIFIGSWMFAMSHKERALFFFVSLASITLCILAKPFVGMNPDEVLDARIVSFIEVFFLSLVAFFFDAYDFNLKLENFFNLRQIEREQKRVTELESFKSRFFTNLTHEFRTPLTLIKGMSREIAEDPKRWSQEGTKMITESANNLLNLINQILDLSKMENQTIPLRMVQGDVVSYLGYIVDSFKGNTIARQIEVHYLCQETQVIMDYDPSQLATIVTNLLSNAVKFSIDGENVYLSLSYHTERGKEEIEISVQDHGVGIPKEELDRIFERFYQVQSTQSSSRIGSGVGLALVKELIDLLNGEITALSAPGKGSQFKVRLPITRNAPMLEPTLHPDGRISLTSHQEHHEVHVEANGNGNGNGNGHGDESLPEILIIDDNPDVVKYLRICLQDLYRITVSKNGEEGIAQAIKSVPDIILCDVLMPVKDGLTACRELKSNSITSHIPFILLSAKADADSRTAGLQAGADVYLVKPFDKNELRAQIQSLLNRFAEYHQRYANPENIQSTIDIVNQAVEDEFITRFRSLVHERLDDSELAVHDLERGLFLSRSQLHKKLKALTGLSAMQFVNRIRLSVARDRLRTNHETVSDIAYQVGYSDPNYFTRAYSAEFGETPSETRKVQN